MDSESPTGSTSHFGRSKRKQTGYSGEHTDGLHLVFHLFRHITTDRFLFYVLFFFNVLKSKAVIFESKQLCDEEIVGSRNA